MIHLHASRDSYGASNAESVYETSNTQSVYKASNTKGTKKSFLMTLQPL